MVSAEELVIVSPARRMRMLPDKLVAQPFDAKIAPRRSVGLHCSSVARPDVAAKAEDDGCGLQARKRQALDI